MRLLTKNYENVAEKMKNGENLRHQEDANFLLELYLLHQSSQRKSHHSWTKNK